MDEVRKGDFDKGKELEGHGGYGLFIGLGDKQGYGSTGGHVG